MEVFKILLRAGSSLHSPLLIRHLLLFLILPCLLLFLLRFFLCHLRFSFNFLFTILFSLLLLGQWLPSFLQLILRHYYWLSPSYLPDILCSCSPLPPFFSHSPCSGSSIAPSINHSLHPSRVSSILDTSISPLITLCIPSPCLHPCIHTSI